MFVSTSLVDLNSLISCVRARAFFDICFVHKAHLRRRMRSRIVKPGKTGAEHRKRGWLKRDGMRRNSTAPRSDGITSNIQAALRTYERITPDTT